MMKNNSIYVLSLAYKTIKRFGFAGRHFFKIANLRTMIEPWTSYLMNVADQGTKSTIPIVSYIMNSTFSVHSKYKPLFGCRNQTVNFFELNTDQQTGKFTESIQGDHPRCSQMEYLVNICIKRLNFLLLSISRLLYILTWRKLLLHPNGSRLASRGFEVLMTW